MRFKKFDLVTEGTDDTKVGTVAEVMDMHKSCPGDAFGDADPFILVCWHNRPAEWIRAHYLYSYAPRAA
jgi:hypothetical protein